jgi:hypothetical protein
VYAYAPRLEGDDSKCPACAAAAKNLYHKTIVTVLKKNCDSISKAL